MKTSALIESAIHLLWDGKDIHDLSDYIHKD